MSGLRFSNMLQFHLFKLRGRFSAIRLFIFKIGAVFLIFGFRICGSSVLPDTGAVFSTIGFQICYRFALPINVIVFLAFDLQ